MVSVIIPVYNGAKFLDNFCLPALVSQSYRDWEGLIIDDGSTDDSGEVARRWQESEPRLKYIRHSENRGLAAALNSGLAAARGDIIAFLEQDDAWLPDKLTRQIRKIDSGFWLADCRFFFYDTIKKKLDGLEGGNFSTLIGRREAIGRLFPLPENKEYLGIEDGIFAGRLALLAARRELPETRICHMQETLVIVSHNHSSLSGHGIAATYVERYRAALDHFAGENSPSLNTLKDFWRRQKRANQLLSLLPRPARSYLRRLKARLRQWPNRRRWREIKNEPQYHEAQKIIAKL